MPPLAPSRAYPFLIAAVLGLLLPWDGASSVQDTPSGELSARLAEHRLEVTLRGEPEAAFALFAGRRADASGRPLSPWPLAYGRLDALGMHELSLATLPPGVDGLVLRVVFRDAGGPRVSAPVRVGAAIGALGTQGAAARPQAGAGLVPFRIIACSLGCTGTPGQIIGCSQVTIFENQELRFHFTLPVALPSVNAASFRLLDVATGLAPAGSVSAAPGDPAALVFRPELSFDPLGNPEFGFKAGAAYQVSIPGVNHDSGPFVQALTGADNLDRLQCAVLPSLGVQDYVPGPPSVAITVDVVTGYDPLTGLPNSFAYGVPANGAQNVWVDSDIHFAFDDVMHAGTLFDFQTGQPTNVRVWVDQDGNLATTFDRVPQAGSFTLQVDVASKSTSLVFDPSPALPHSGGGPTPVLIVVETKPGVVDIVGNPLGNSGSISFQTER